MQTLLTDLNYLIKKHWKTILIIVLSFYFIHNYSDIKHGILDGFTEK